jgi:hypothetical protein
MNYLITESQFDLIRRYDTLKQLVNDACETVTDQDDISDYTFNDFLEEVKWQVSDESEDLKLGDIDYLHNLIEKHFYGQIKKFYNSVQSPDDDEDDDDYYSDYLYGVDNNQ